MESKQEFLLLHSVSEGMLINTVFPIRGNTIVEK